MNFHLLDMDNWNPREYYQHYTNEVVCTYSMPANLDITALGQKLYPAIALAAHRYGK